MARYGITRMLRIKAEDSVDGKEHRRKLWYSGSMNLFGMSAPIWGARKDRKLFDTKAEANKVVKRFCMADRKDIKVETI